MDDTKRAETRLAKARERIQLFNSEIPQLEKEIEHIKFQLELKRLTLKSTMEEEEDLRNRITSNEQKVLGLCIRYKQIVDSSLFVFNHHTTIVRCLDAHSLSSVFSFLKPNGVPPLVCKYWRAIYLSTN